MFGLRAFYERIGGDYEDLMRRLNKEERIIRLLYMLLQDNTFTQLHQALEEKDDKTAFRAVHSLKGTCVNLGLNSVIPAVSELTEALRRGESETNIDLLYQRLTVEYETMIVQVRDYLEQLAR